MKPARDILLTAQKVQILGYILLIIAIASAIFLYQSFAYSTYEKVVYAAVGLVIALCSALLLPLAGIVGRYSFALKVTVFLFWVLAVGLGINTHLGFMAVSQADMQAAKAAGSVAVEVADNELQLAQEQMRQYATFAAIDVATLESQRSTLETRLSDLKTQLTACPKNYFTNCINPLKSQIRTVENELQPIVANLQGYTQYQTATLAKSTALKDKSAALAGNGSTIVNSTIHPLFITQARAAEFAGYRWQPSYLQALLLSYTALFLELVTALLFTVAAKLRDNVQFIPIEGEYQDITDNSLMKITNSLEDLQLKLVALESKKA